MKLLEHFRVLYRFLDESAGPTGEGEPIRVTIDALASALACTPRNVKLLLRRMEQAGWIAWQPGRGRGHGSELTLQAAPDELLVESALREAEAGDWQEAVKLLEEAAASGLGTEPAGRLLSRLLVAGGYTTRTEGERRKDVLRFPSYRPLDGLDPAYAIRRTELHMISQLFDTLVWYDPVKGSCEPNLVYGWEADRTCRSWTFVLRKGIWFHNGRELRAIDAVYTLQRLSDNARSPYGWIGANIRGIHPHDETMFTVTLAEPDPSFPAKLSVSGASIVPQELNGLSPEAFARSPIGTGAFRLVRNDRQALALEANPYAGKSRPFLDRVEAWFIPELYENMNAGMALDRYGANFQQYPYAQLHAGWTRTERIDSGCKYMTVNLNKPGPLRSPALRRAIAHALELRRMIRELGGNRHVPASGFVWDHDDGEHTEEAAFESPAQALNLCEQKISLELHTYPGAGNEKDAEWIVGALAGIGIRLQLVYHPFDELMRLVSDGLSSADFILLEQANEPDPEAVFPMLAQSKQSPLACHMGCGLRAEWNDIMKSNESDLHRASRLERLRGFERRLYAERAVLFLYRMLQTAFYPEEWTGVELTSYGWVDYRKLRARRPALP